MVKLFVLGIDGAVPETVFGKWLDELPNIKKLMKEGCYAILNSSDPPLSITAWASIYSGKSPADTGIFEYIYRENKFYDKMRVMTSRNLKEKTFWEILSDKNKTSIIFNTILTWPIKPFNGYLFCGTQRPEGPDVDSIYPRDLKDELIKEFGEIPRYDIPMFRSSYKLPEEDVRIKELSQDFVIEECYKLEENHVEIMKYLIKNKKWDLFFGIIGATDRMNHGFWKYCDENHRKYDPNSKYKNSLKDFYKFVDKKVGELINLLDKDTKIIILSDHGIKRLHTRINLTDWLIKEGYMKLKKPITEKTVFNFSMVDWEKTKVFAIGAYEGQIFINLKGREPGGIVNKKEYNNLIFELTEKLKKIPGELGEKLNTKILIKKRDYNGKLIEEAPDMIVYFDNLEYGSNNSLIGNNTLWSPSTAKGSDDATHSEQGIFIMNNKKCKGNLGEISYLDISPTIFHELDMEIPKDMIGKIIK